MADEDIALILGRFVQVKCWKNVEGSYHTTIYVAYNSIVFTLRFTRIKNVPSFNATVASNCTFQGSYAWYISMASVNRKSKHKINFKCFRIKSDLNGISFQRPKLFFFYVYVFFEG